MIHLTNFTFNCITRLQFENEEIYIEGMLHMKSQTRNLYNIQILGIMTLFLYSVYQNMDHRSFISQKKKKDTFYSTGW